MDSIEHKYVEFSFPEDATPEDLLEFFKSIATFTIDVNSKDPKVQRWVHDHKHWFKKGGE